MDGRIIFYTYGTTMELNGHPFSAGELTENLINLTPDDYDVIRTKAERVIDLAGRYNRNWDVSVWRKLNSEMSALSTELKKYTVFRMLLDDDDLFAKTEELLNRYDPATPVEFTEQDMELYSQLLEADGKESLSDLPLSLLLYPGDMTDKWEFYFSHVTRYGSYVTDIYAFNQTIRNFINFILSRLETNSPESYAQALYNFYNDPRLVDKLIVNPFNSTASYNKHDEYMLSYVPRELPDGRVAICQEHVTDSLQALMKADYMLALTSGYNIRRCLICHRYFLVKSGVHALYCEGACPHAPQYTCRQFGSYERQKELARDIPKVRVKVTAFERITKDAKRGAISKEDERRAKDYVRDKLYEALRRTDISVDDFEASIASERIYSVLNITRTAKPRGRPKKTGGEAV